MTNTDMIKVKNLMYKLFPSARMYSDTYWDIDDSSFVHYLGINMCIKGHLTANDELEISVDNCNTHETVCEKILSGEWREVMDNIVNIAENVGVKSVFYQ